MKIAIKRNKWYRDRKKVQTVRKLRRSGKNLVGTGCSPVMLGEVRSVKRKCRGTKVYCDVKVLNV